MLKQRLVAFLPVKSGIVVQSIGFERYLPVGKPRIAVEFLNQWGIDEIILVDIEATSLGRCVDSEMIRGVSKACFVPLTVGGGIRSVSDMVKVIHSGADKISINTAALRTPELIKQGAEIFGSQCIIVSIDTKRNQNGSYEVFMMPSHEATGISPVELAKRVEGLGAGEILLNSIDRDGTKTGYDLQLAQEVANSVKIPVIVCGGVGHPVHFSEGLQLANVSAVAAGNFFHFSEHSATITKDLRSTN
jgi:cyclase